MLNHRLFDPRKAVKDDLDGLVDKILVKVHEQGETSLTDVEREVLRIAGQRYRGGPLMFAAVGRRPLGSRRNGPAGWRWRDGTKSGAIGSASALAG
jgi:hypothetical protein